MSLVIFTCVVGLIIAPQEINFMSATFSLMAVAIGAGSDQVNDFLDKKYTSEITLDQACVLAIESIYLVSEDKIATNHVKMAVIDAKTQLHTHLDTDKIASLADKASTR